MPADVITVEFYSQAEPDKLLAAADLDGKELYVIENGSTVIPYVSEV